MEQQKTKEVRKVKGYEQFDAAKFIQEQGSISQAIRALDKKGLARGDIAILLNKRYQHVRNVLITPVKNPGK